MIRIDLGKDNKKEGDGLQKLASRLKLQQPYEELLARFDNDINRVIALVVAIVFAVVPSLFVSEYERVVKANYERKGQAVDKEVAVVEGEIQGLMHFKQELESYENQKKQLSQRLSVLRQLADTRGTPVATMDAVGQSLPEGVWLESIDYDGSNPASEKIRLQGKALSNEGISDFVDRLSQSAYLRNVRIGTVDSGQYLGIAIRAFNLELTALTPTMDMPVRDVGGAPGE